MGKQTSMSERALKKDMSCRIDVLVCVVRGYYLVSSSNIGEIGETTNTPIALNSPSNCICENNIRKSAGPMCEHQLSLI